MPRPTQSFVAAVLFALSLAGCGGGKKPGLSLDAQFQKAQTIEESGARVTELLKVAAKQHTAADSLGCEKSLNTAAAAAETIEDAESRATSLNRVAAAMARLDHATEAKELLKKVRKAAEQIADGPAKVAAYSALAKTYSENLKDANSAKSYLSIGEEALPAIADPADRVAAQMEIAFAFHTLGDAAAAQERTTAALAAARELADQRKRADLIGLAACRLLKMDQADAAKPVLEEAQQAIDQIEDKLSHAYALVEFSDNLHDAGDTAAAKQTLDKAAAEKITDASMRPSLDEQIQRSRRAQGAGKKK